MNLIKSYLNVRLQILLIDKTYPYDNVSYSNWEEAKNGVTQGLILGRLHFLFNFNDFVQNSN
jgi:hypothetical protein